MNSLLHTFGSLLRTTYSILQVLLSTRVAVHHKRHRIHQSSSLLYSYSVIISIVVAVTHSSWIGIDRNYRDHDYGNDRSMDGSSIDGR